MNTKIFSMSAIVVAAFLVIGGVYYVGAKKAGQQTPKTSVNEAQTTPVVKPEIFTMVSPARPQPNDVVESPYTFEGVARGTWFFEASFPVRVEDANGNVLGRGIAQAEGDWMTEDFVQFRGTVNFTSDRDQPGRMVFEKDNPSGLPQHDGEVAVPVQLKMSDVTRFNVYFGNSVTDPGVINCERVYPVQRVVPKTQGVARAALEALFNGPTEDEKARGSFTFMNEDPKPLVNRLEIKNRIAYADFNSALNDKVGGSCKVLGIRAQIEWTLKQFPTVDRVVISVNGQTENILEP